MCTRAFVLPSVESVSRFDRQDRLHVNRWFGDRWYCKENLDGETALSGKSLREVVGSV